MFSIRKPFHKYKNSKMLIIYFAVQKIKTNIWILKYSFYSSMAFIFEKSSSFFFSQDINSFNVINCSSQIREFITLI